MNANRWSHKVTEREKGERIDTLLPQLISSLSRSRAGKLIDDGCVKVNGRAIKRSYRLKVGDGIEVTIPPPESPVPEPEAMPLKIVYEDDYLMVVEKPAGTVVHPGAGHRRKTLVHGLLYHCREISGVGDFTRPGIVHRLDKDTSGLLVVAKKEETHRSLAESFKNRQIEKVYFAIVYGEMAKDEGIIDLPLGRHPRQRVIMSPRSRHPKEAVTEWKVKERLPAATWLEVHLRTGRTHQIRVHLNEAGHPVVGDPTYGRHKEIRRQAESLWKKNRIELPKRQLLHACRLCFLHPVTGVRLELTSPMPSDMVDFYLRLKDTGHV
ncbi:MAG: RluA family pseudouridine synthase [Syntrophales bacterium]|nr:RluA family pseudouridine synthase [Syntrophales bacterium]